jgi:hypothetical protein
LSKYVNGQNIKAVIKTLISMKYIIVAICMTFLIVSVISCNKPGVQTNPLADKWNIINDSLSIISLSGTNYIGTSDDYYNFTVNGTLYIKEDSVQYTATYSMIADNQIDIGYDLPNDVADHRTYYITNLSAHTATLTLSDASLGPAERQIINLKK